MLKVNTRVSFLKSQLNKYCGFVEYVSLGSGYKKAFQGFLFISGSAIGAGVYHFCNNPADLNSIFHQFFGKGKKKEENVQTNMGRIITVDKNTNMDEKIIKTHLFVLGVKKADFKTILKNKIENNEKLVVSEIIDEILANYKKVGQDYEIYKDDKIFKVKEHETKVLESKMNDEKLGVTESKIVTKLKCDQADYPKLYQSIFWHYSNVFLFSTFVGFNSLVTFGRYCHLHDFFMNPIQKSNIFPSIIRAFGLSVGSAIVLSVPVLVLQMYFQPHSVKRQYNPKSAEFVDIELPNLNKDFSTITFFNAKFNRVSDDLAECVTSTLSLKEV